MAPRRLAPALALAVALGAAGCGGSSGGHEKPAATPPPSSRSHPAADADIKVIKGWVDTLRAGHVNAAAAYFALPAIVENGTPPIRLRTRTEVRAFNGLLPCGARLERTFATGRYVAAVFKLTNRPGGRCGSGVGQEAATAFVIRAGKIAEWRRVPLPSEGAPQPPPPAPHPAEPKPQTQAS